MSSTFEFKYTRGEHRAPDGAGGVLLVLIFAWEFIRSFPTLLKIAPYYWFRKSNLENPHVLICSDNLDETNGIAINSRQFVSHLKAAGHHVTLMGIAFHTKESGLIEENGTILLPQCYSMQQVGYEHSELAIPHLRDFYRWIRQNPVDLIELETPSCGCTLFLYAAKCLNIPVISHYRTDINSYSKILVEFAWLRWLISLWVMFFCKNTAPVIVPSRDFATKMKMEMGLAENQIQLLPRAIDLKRFSPFKKLDLWNSCFANQSLSPNKKMRCLFVGRISKEKEIPFLEHVWREFRKNNEAEIELLFVGDGPYLIELKERMQDCPEVGFAGKRHGAELASLFAEADLFVFPSGNDTFGNVIVEALASGVPVLVSDEGGPKDIVGTCAVGQVLAFRQIDQWVKALKKWQPLLADDEWREECRKDCVQRADFFEFKSVMPIWMNFYKRILS